MKSKRKIRFRLLDSNGKCIMDLGYLSWPCAISSVSLHGDIAEVLEVGGKRATFSLKDIRLEDLRVS